MHHVRGSLLLGFGLNLPHSRKLTGDASALGPLWLLPVVIHVEVVEFCDIQVDVYVLLHGLEPIVV